MAIKLCVDPNCMECALFEPNIRYKKHFTTLKEARAGIIMRDVIIQCGHKKMCQYLKVVNFTDEEGKEVHD